MKKILERLGLIDWFGLTGLGITVVLGGGMAALLGGTFAFACWLDATACSQYAQTTGRATRFRIPSGCYVQAGGHFIPVDEFRARAITNEAALQGEAPNE